MRGSSWLLCGVALSLAPISMAHAQQAAAPAEAVDEGGLQEIVVTAQKRAENLQNVPISVSAVTSASLSNLQATSLQALQGSIPNVQINEFANAPNTAVYNIRGIGVADADPYAGNAVSIVVDGVPQYFSMGALLDLFDVDRVEILRGPQGTLFGANTTGGVVNVVTAQPTGQFGGKAELTVGNYNRFDLKGALDFPIVEGLLAGKVAFVHSERDGFVTNLFDGSDMGSRNLDAIRTYLKFTPDGDFSATLVGEYAAARNGAPVVVNVSSPTEVIRAPEGTPGQQTAICLPVGQPCRAAKRYVSANNSVPDQSNFDNYRATLTMELADTAIGDITSVTGIKTFKLGEYTDQDGTVLFLDDTYRRTKGRQVSQELRTAFDLGDRVRGIAGVFWLDTHYRHIQDFRAQFAIPGFSQYNRQHQDNHSLSAFSQLYFDATDALTLQAGVRYTYEKTKMTAGMDNCLDPSGVASFGCGTNIGGFSVSGSKSWNNVGWKIGADYKLDPRVMLYAYWARGFKSGGFVGRIGIPEDLGPYDPEHIDTIEGGVKADLFGRRLRTNLSVFYTNYRDIQLAQQYFLNGGTQQGNTILNAAKAIIKGAELEVTALPVEGLTLSGSAAYLDATYKNFDFFDAPTASFIDLSGYRLQNAPKWTASVNATYAFDVTGLGHFSANVAYNYVASKYLTNLTDTPRSRIQPTNIVNANLDFTPADGPVTLSLWAKNLFDKRYIQSILDIPGTVALLNYANPREYGASARVKF